MTTQISRLPDFENIDPKNVVETLSTMIEAQKAKIKSLCETADLTWPDVMDPLQVLSDELSRFWSPVSHLNAVVNTPEMREAYNQSVVLLSQFSTEMGQHKPLYDLIHRLSQSESMNDCSGEQKTVISKTLRDFKLSGIDLVEPERTEFGELSSELAKLGSQFSDNVLDSTQAWQKHITDETQLSGLPEAAKNMAAQFAEAASLEGWLLKLEMPMYIAVLTYSDNEELRKEMYTAYNTRASEHCVDGPQWDNTKVINEIIKLRQRMAEILGFKNYAEYSLANKMAGSSDEVFGFLNQLAEKSYSQATEEFKTLQDYAKKKNHQTLNAWDVGYFSEKLKVEKHNISEEELKPYFPADKVICGLFSVVEKLFDVIIKEIPGVKTYHEDVQFYQITDKAGLIVGQFYFDLYARQNKRGGAWMADCSSRFKVGNQRQIPVAFMTCNATPPIGEAKALLSHNEVITLFHEFGHGLHHMLTTVDQFDISGISGVEWDAVELPSQFLENWCWEAESLKLISGHHETGESIPDDLLARAKAAKNFQSAMGIIRQIEFSLFDFQIHVDAGNSVVDFMQTLNSIRSKIAVTPAPDTNRFPCAFSHIFAGGYAAGYYSYKWAEVLSADAYSKFEETELFDKESGISFKQEILERGASRSAMESFEAFRGRKPSVDALLRHNGLQMG